MHPLRLLLASLSLLSLPHCTTPSPKQQAFPALNSQIEKQVKTGRNVVYPALLHSVKPGFPSLPAAGSVWAVMRVGQAGRVQEVKTVGEAPELYQDAIREALLQWRFRPGTVDGQATEFPMQVKVTFEGPSSQKQPPSGTKPKDGIQIKNEQWIVRSVFPQLHQQLSTLIRQGRKMTGPKVIKTWKPRHPDPRAEGSVFVTFVINENAQAEQIHIIGDAPPLFQQVIADALKKWEFQAGTVDGKPHPYPVAGKWTFNSETVFMIKP